MSRTSQPDGFFDHPMAGERLGLTPDERTLSQLAGDLQIKPTETDDAVAPPILTEAREQRLWPDAEGKTTTIPEPYALDRSAAGDARAYLRRLEDKDPETALQIARSISEAYQQTPDDPKAVLRYARFTLTLGKEGLKTELSESEQELRAALLGESQAAVNILRNNPGLDYEQEFVLSRIQQGVDRAHKRLLTPKTVDQLASASKSSENSKAWVRMRQQAAALISGEVLPD